jgi:hypothetical protein
VTIEPQSSQRVNAHGKAMSSEAIFYLACNTDNPHKIFVSFGPYQGTALDNIDNASRPVVFVTKDQDGSSQKFPEEMHYYSGDSEWILNDSSPLPSVLDEFDRGGLLTMLNGRGDKVLDVALIGAGKAREAIRSVCHM